MNIVILAAGKGTRMKSDQPKVLHPIGGIPMLAHVMKTAGTLKPSRCVLVAGHGAEQVKSFCEEAKESLGLPDVQWAIQDPPMGTGHAMQMAAPFLDHSELTLILYGDVPLLTVQTLTRLIESAKKAKGMALLTAHVPDARGYGRIVRDGSSLIESVVEEKDANEKIRAISEINTGTLIAPTALLRKWLGMLTNNNAQKEFYLTDVIGMAAKEGIQIASAHPESEDEILGINSQDQRAHLERRFQRRLASAAMAQGVALADADRFDVRGSLTCETGVQIDVGCVFEGQVFLGRGVVIHPHCVIRNSRIEEGSVIEAFSHIDQSAVGPKSVVGPYARLRPGTVLGEGAHVGNFVEIKNSTLGPRSKANHLSYLGDAEIGARVNIGAGTITCNYDGAEKHRTVIEDDAFIGSDTQLVAPVTVGKGATLGAGTTLTQDAPANQLTVSRSPQVSIPRWRRPQKKAH